MKHRRFLKDSPVILKLLVILPAVLLAPFAARAQSLAELPNAPVPAASLPGAEPGQANTQVTQPGKPDPGKGGAVDHAPYQKRKWSQYVDPGERVPRLSVHDKMNFWLHQEARVSSVFPAVVSAGYGQLTDTPQYGSDSGAFGDRLGAAFLRQATMRFFSSSAIPALDGEDPRYYREASESYAHRAAWAVEQTFVGRRDSGRRSFNVSNIFGHLAASALTPLYYPARSANAAVVMQTWGTSIAGDAGNNLFLEFWPDVVHGLHRNSHRPEDGASGAP